MAQKEQGGKTQRGNARRERGSRVRERGGVPRRRLAKGENGQENAAKDKEPEGSGEKIFGW